MSARTTLLCSHTLVGAVKSTQRMGTLNLAARAIQSARVSASALVLSGCRDQQRVTSASARIFVPITTLVPSSNIAVAVFRHFSRCFNTLLESGEVAQHVSVALFPARHADLQI